MSTSSELPSLTQEERITTLIDAGILTIAKIFVGVTSDDVAAIVKAGHGELSLLVRLRARFDDRKTMTAEQLLNAPRELLDIVYDVFVIKKRLQRKDA